MELISYNDHLPCDRCGQPFPGEHEQEIDPGHGGPPYDSFVFWTCPFIEESENDN